MARVFQKCLLQPSCRCPEFEIGSIAESDIASTATEVCPEFDRRHRNVRQWVPKLSVAIKPGRSWGVVMNLVTRVIIGVAALLNARATLAQMYDPHYAVCMHVYGEKLGERMDCTFNSLDQCAATASGLPATCLINPYYADVRTRKPQRKRR